MFGRQTKRSVGAQDSSKTSDNVMLKGGVTYWAKETPSAVALVNANRTVTYDELEARATKLAHSLIRMGIKTQDRILLRLPTSIEQIEMTVVAAKIGCLVVPLDPGTGLDEFASAIREVSPGLVACEDGIWSQLCSKYPEIAEIKSLVVANPDRAISSKLAPGICVEYESLIRSVGPGLPDLPSYSGARLGIYNPSIASSQETLKESWPDQHSVASSQAAQIKLWMLSSNDVYLLSSGSHHPGAGGWAQLCLYSGASVIIMGEWNPLSWLEMVESNKVSRTFLTPGQITDLVEVSEDIWGKFDLSSLRSIVHGGTQCAAALKLRAIERFAPVTLWGIYGESDRLVSRISSNEWIEHPGSVGKPIAGIAVEIRNEDDKLCSPNVSGGVFWRVAEKEQIEDRGQDGDKHSRVDKHEQTSLGESSKSSLKLYGGRHIGHLDEDGYLYITDKASEKIKVGNVSIYPWEVENVIHGHREVLDCVVFKDDARSREPGLIALVVTRSKNSDTDISEHCRKYLPTFRLPSKIVRVEKLDRDEAGKINRKLYAKRYFDGEWDENTQIAVPIVTHDGDGELTQLQV